MPTAQQTRHVIRLGRVMIVVSDQQRALDLYAGTLGFADGFTGMSLESGDVDGFRAHLVAAGADVDPAVTRMDGPVPPRCTFRDPDGNEFDVAGAE